MKLHFFFLISILLQSCIITGYDVKVSRHLNSHIYLGDYDGIYGIWTLAHKSPMDTTKYYSYLYFRDPDTILVVDSYYILAQRNETYWISFEDTLNNEYVRTTKSEKKINRYVLSTKR